MIKLIPSVSPYMPARAAPYKNREEVRLWTPKREVIEQLDRLTATRSRLVKVRKIRTADATPLPPD